MTVAGVTFIIMTCKLVYKEYIIKNCSEALDPTTCTEMGFMPLLKEIVRYFIVAVTVVVVAIPEGLPLAVSIAMAFSGGAMRNDNLLVKKNEACENLAFINNICTGKTGTLTTAEMIVEKFYYAGTAMNPIENKTNQFLNIHLDKLEIIKSCIIMNNNSRLEMQY